MCCSPGIDVSPDIDSWIDKFCLDADVFVCIMYVLPFWRNKDIYIYMYIYIYIRYRLKFET